MFILIFVCPEVVEEYDCALAAEYMILAAHSLGIGNCWIGLAMGLGEDKEFLKEAGMPEGFKYIAPIILGCSSIRSSELRPSPKP